MVNSMTGFAARKGAAPGLDWAWDLRSVNGKGYDLRLRLPEGIAGLEAAVRGEVGRGVTRGNVSLTLKLARVIEADALRVNTGALASVLAALHVVEDAAVEANLRLAPTTGADLLALRGVLESGSADGDTAVLLAALLADLPGLLADFARARAAEGTALTTILADQVTRIAALAATARTQAEARRPQIAATLRSNLARVIDNSDGVDPSRVAMELAMLAVKADVTEELDRLEAHVTAAGALLDDAAPIGRKLDFLMQDFMREANTLCSKAASADLTRTGLDLKVVIDQMREQVQNVE